MPGRPETYINTVGQCPFQEIVGEKGCNVPSDLECNSDWSKCNKKEKKIETVTLSEQEAKNFIYFKESSNNPRAINSTSGACGLGQALPCSKLPCTLDDYECQDKWFSDYAIRRYGSWVNAKAFWDKNNWW